MTENTCKEHIKEPKTWIKLLKELVGPENVGQVQQVLGHLFVSQMREADSRR